MSDPIDLVGLLPKQTIYPSNDAFLGGLRGVSRVAGMVSLDFGSSKSREGITDVCF